MKENSVELLTINEVRKILRVGNNTILKFIHEKRIPARKIGRNYMIEKDDLTTFLEQCKM